jgi:DNA-binding NarL/FixJ family response regulator
MKNYNSKENKYTNIKGSDILERAKYCQHLHSKGMSVKDIAEKFNLSESRIRQYLKN